MNKLGCSRWGIWLTGIVLLLVCVAGVAIAFSQARNHAFDSRPLVLIHSPINHDRLTVGDGVFVLATAREDSGLSRVELWVDDELVAVRDVTEFTTTLTLSSNWIPTTAGAHILLVRAIATNDVQGQSMVTVQVDSGEMGGATHIVQEGETADSIASDYGISLEDLSASNPDLGSAAPGDELIIPDEESASAPAPAPAESGEAPSEEADAPGSTNPFEMLWLIFPIEPAAEEGALTSLRVEVLSLQTSQTFDSLHCYVGFASGSPKWFPDADGDPTTDESFAALSDGRWDVEPYLAGGSALVAAWPDSESLPLSISCVGIAGGGTDALELGLIERSIPPDDWDGVSRSVGADGEGGHIEIEYRITSTGDTPRGIPLYLDTTMTAPSNARLDDRRNSLRWDYEPDLHREPPEEPIDGFRIYLNGNLQWIEPADARESMLPYEWFSPPCGTTYRFAVTAYRDGVPEGPESYPSVATLEQPAEDCTRRVLVTFTTLETFDLGGDGHHEDRHGDVGPPQGNFHASSEFISFDAGDLGHSGLDMPNGFSHNTTYDLLALSTDPSWGFEGMLAFAVDIPEGGSLEFGYYIMDEDSGWCGSSGGRGCDDLICTASSMFYTNPVDFDHWQEGALTSDNGRCRVSYTFGPAPGSPVGSGVEGAEPLPWIDVEDIRMDPATGNLQVQIRNTGTATWPWKDLDVELRKRNGETISTFTWPSFVLEAGADTTLGFPPNVVPPPYDVCVFIDPADKVLEEYERSGAMRHGPSCPTLPDLIITNVQYTDSGEDALLDVMVQNVGDGALESRTVGVEAYLPDGSSLYLVRSLPNVTLEPGESLSLQLVGITEAIRERMRGGYSVVVNPDVRFAESDHSNNTYEVPGTERLLIYWQRVRAPRDYEDDSSFFLDAYIISGDTRRQIAEWGIREGFDWTVCWDTYCDRGFYTDDYNTSWFEIYGDESLEIAAGVTQGALIITNATQIYTPQDGWGAAPTDSENCQRPISGAESGMPHEWILTHAGWTWGTTFYICSDSAEE